MEREHSREVIPGERDRHLLVAVDSSLKSDQVVLYVADFLGGIPGFHVTLFHVVLAPQVDIFSNEGDQERWVRGKDEARVFLRRYRDILVQAGFPQERVDTMFLTTERESVAEAIMKKHGELGSCTVVVGRREKTRQEEFLFGSVSGQIVRNASKCSVWVVG